VVVALIVKEARGGNVSLLPWLATAIGIQLVLPILAYPFSKTIWAAFDLIMRPLDPAEEAESILRREGGEGPRGK
jgi:hypothetical protein